MSKPSFLNYFSKTVAYFKKNYFNSLNLKNYKKGESYSQKLFRDLTEISNCDLKDPGIIRNIVLNKRIHSFLFKTSRIRFHQINSNLSRKIKQENFDNCFLNSILRIYYRELNQKKLKKFFLKPIPFFLAKKRKILHN